MSAPNGYHVRASRMRALARDRNRAPLRRSREAEGPSFPPPQQDHIINLEANDDDINIIDSPPRAFSQVSAPNGYHVRAARMSALGPDQILAPQRRSREAEGPSFPPPQQNHIIYLEASYDDMNIIPRAISQVRAARRTHGRLSDIMELDQSTEADNNNIRRSRRVLNRTQIISEGSSNSMAPELPRESIFKCPLCMDSIVEEMSTMCGHIFCKKCITTAVEIHGKCPICREFVIMEELRRVFLPTPN